MKKLFKYLSYKLNLYLPETTCGYYWRWIMFIALPAIYFYGMYVCFNGRIFQAGKIDFSLILQVTCFVMFTLFTVLLIVVAGDCFFTSDYWIDFKEKFCKPIKWD